jgi:hypothetical protein
MSKETAQPTGLATLTSLPTSNVSLSTLAQYSSGFVSRLQLVTKGKLVDEGKVKPGNYAIVRSESDVVDLGPSVDILVLSVREKALDTNENPPIASFDSSSDLYQQIVENSKTANSGCMHGPSFLVYERTQGEFLEFYCGNASGRQEAGKIGTFLPISQEQADKCNAANGTTNFKAQGPLAGTLSAKYVKRPKHAWHAPVMGKCSTPFDKLPTQDECVKQITSFLSTKEAAVEVAPEQKRAR